MKISFFVIFSLIINLFLCGTNLRAESPPNILLAISDDQSYPHTSAYGEPEINTPAFDRIAREGVLLTNAFVQSPGYSPSRASLFKKIQHY